MSPTPHGLVQHSLQPHSVGSLPLKFRTVESTQSTVVPCTSGGLLVERNGNALSGQVEPKQNNSTFKFPP